MIEVNIEGALPEGLMATPEVIAVVLPDILNQAHQRLSALANERLNTSAQDYIGGIQPAVSHIRGLKIPDDGRIGTIVLTGWLPNAIEHGWAGGDMKPWLLAGRNAKVSLDGKTRYNVVPFRHGSPGSNRNHFPPMGSAYEPSFARAPGGGFERRGVSSHGEAAKMGRRVHRQAKKLTEARSRPGGGTEWGSRLRSGLAPKLREHHRTDIYAGMVRFSKFYKSKDQPHYGTFRAVSDNSDTRAWIHPGIHGEHLFDELAREIPKIASFLIGHALRGVGS